MAEVRRCFGRGADEFLLKTCKHYLLKRYNQYSRTSVRAASLSVGLLLDDTFNVRLHGAENAAGRAAAGASQDSYTRVKLLSDTEDENHCYSVLISYVVPNQNRVQTVPRKLPQYQSHVKVRRTLSSSLRGHRSPGRMHLHSGQFACIRAFSGNGARPEPPYKTKTGYYEILEVSPTATHAQIKTAYYKQSFTYHPDRNAGSDDATVRFSEISEAYMVLGNKGLRKKYDRGLLTLADLTATRRPSGKDAAGAGGSGRPQSQRSVVSADQRGGVFDFDLFFKSHYSDQLQRQRDIRVRKEQMQRRKEETMGEKKMDKMLEIGVGVLLLMAMGLILSMRKP